MADIETRNFETANTFVDALRPQKWIESNDWAMKWLFRGQGDSQWRLMPTTFRWNMISKPLNESEMLLERTMYTHRNSIDSLLDDEIQQRSKIFADWDPDKIQNFRSLVHLANAERELLLEFVRFLDKMGLPTGDYTSLQYSLGAEQGLREYISYLRGTARLNTSSRWHSHTVGLAQHHGVPTRLLDWTKNPLIAAYFAAESLSSSASHVSVFALKVGESRINRVTMLEIPASISKYIHAQAGVFTIDMLAETEYLRTGCFPSLEEKIYGVVTNNDHLVDNDYTLVKHLLPAGEVGNLLRLLWIENITRAHVMPTIDNIVVALKAKWKYT